MFGTTFARDRSVSEKSEELKARTEAFAVNVVKFCDTLPNTMAGRRIGQQLLDAGTSVGANYRRFVEPIRMDCLYRSLRS